MTIQDILVPVDFSRCSGAALDVAVQYAERFGARVHLLHAYVDPIASVPFGRDGISGPPTAPIEVLQDARRAREAEAAKLQARCEEHGVEAKVDEIEGDPKRVIVDYAGQMGADMIVMGTHGRSGVTRMLLGSVAERTVRSASCPVLTVPREEEGAARAVRRIVCATDLTSVSARAVEVATSMAKAFGASLTLVHVVHAAPYLGWDGAAAMAAIHDSYLDELRRGAKESLAELAQGIEGVSVDTNVFNGVPHEVLGSLAKEADLLVLGTHGRGGVEHMLIGSVAERTVRLAEGAVLTVRTAAD